MPSRASLVSDIRARLAQAERDAELYRDLLTALEARSEPTPQPTEEDRAWAKAFRERHGIR